LRLALPLLEPLLAENVAKEARKDALLIRAAARARAGGAPAGGVVAQELLAAARRVDAEFLRRVGAWVRIEIPYARIEPLRLRRIEAGLDLACRILQGWRRRARLQGVLGREELTRRLREWLELYALETQALSDAVRLPVLLRPARERLAQALARAMREAAEELTREIARRVYRPVRSGR
jgi:hypothetical protein